MRGIMKILLLFILSIVAVVVQPIFAGGQNQTNAEAYSDRGFAYFLEEEYDKAISDYDEAIRLNPKLAKAYFGRGFTYHKIGDYDKAVSDYSQAIRLNLKFADAYYYRGRVYHYKEDYDRAISDYNQAIRLNPNDAEAYYKRGGAYLNKENYDKAISDYTKAIQLNPNNAEAYYERSFMYATKGDYQRVIADLESALRIDPYHTDARKILEKIRENSPISKGVFTDSRDGKKYKTIKIGNQTWMAENLNYNASGSVCYNNNSGYCQIYGRLYNWYAALSACPSGWHLPSYNEWEVLSKAVGGEYVAGKKLKAKSGWNNNGNGTDEFSFSALPGGGGYSRGRFDSVGGDGGWWSSSENDDDNAYFQYMNCGYEHAGWLLSIKSNLNSVRCLQN